MQLILQPDLVVEQAVSLGYYPTWAAEQEGARFGC